MLKRITFLMAALTLLTTTGACAEPVIAGQTAEIQKVDCKNVGTNCFITLSDGRTIKVPRKTADLIAAAELTIPEAIVAVPQATVVRAPRNVPALGAAVIAAAVPRGVEPVPVFVVERNRVLDAGRSTNVYPAEVVALSAVQHGSAIAVPGGAPIVREEGFYVFGTETDDVALTSIRLRDGSWVTIADRVQRPTVIEGDVDFDPAALRPGAYVRIVKREDGSYFLASAAPPREQFPGVPAGKVSHVDPGAQVVVLTDGSMVHPRANASAVLMVGAQPVDPAALTPGTWVVIDPSPVLTVEAPSAIPADTVVKGKLMRVLPGRGAQ